MADHDEPPEPFLAAVRGALADRRAGYDSPDAHRRIIDGATRAERRRILAAQIARRFRR